MLFEMGMLQELDRKGKGHDKKPVRKKNALNQSKHRLVLSDKEGLQQEKLQKRKEIAKSIKKRTKPEKSHKWIFHHESIYAKFGWVSSSPFDSSSRDKKVFPVLKDYDT